MVALFHSVISLSLSLSLQWVVTEQSCNYFSRVSVPLYDTLGTEALVHILNQGDH